MLYIGYVLTIFGLLAIFSFLGMIIILSKETNPVTSARAKKLNIPCKYGANDKLSSLKTELINYKVEIEEVCFVGNDLNDIDCIKEVNLGVAVSDSYPQVLKIADYVTIRKGGHGAVREICELIMYSKGVHPFP